MSQSTTDARSRRSSRRLTGLRAGKGTALTLTAVASAVALASPALSSSALAAGAVMDSQAPTPAANLHSTATSASSVTLGWSPATDNVAVDHYELWRGDANWSAWTLAATIPASSLSYVNSGLAAGTGYTYGLRAFDAAGNRSASSNVPLINTSSPGAPVDDTVAPTAAQRLRVTATGSTSVSLAWDVATDNVGVHHYEVWRGDASWSNWTMVGTATGAAPSFVDRGLVANAGYTYGVRSLDAAGNISASSNITLAHTGALTPGPTPTPTPTPTPIPTPTPNPGPASSMLYGPNSPIYQPIPTSAMLDPNNAAWTAHVGQSQFYLNTFTYGMAIVRATGAERRFTVRTAHDGDWGSAFGSKTVPLDPAWRATTGSDGWLCVMEADGSRGYWLWQYNWNNGNPTASWGGSGPYGAGVADPWGDSGSGGGAGIVPPGLVINKADLARGYINHALATADPLTSTSWKYPAKSSDGKNSGSSAIPEGQRLRLDPSINVDAQSWPMIEKMIAKALQTYGAYVVDTSGGSMGLSGEMDQTQVGNDPGAMWRAVGVTQEYQLMNNIPMNRLQFLRTWNGA